MSRTTVPQNYPAAAEQPDSANAQMNVAGRFVDVAGLSNYLGLPTSWIYDRTGPSSNDRIPHFKIHNPGVSHRLSISLRASHQRISPSCCVDSQASEHQNG